MVTKKEALKEKAKRELERRHVDKQDSLMEFIKYFFKHERKQDFAENWHFKKIAEKLEAVVRGECNRLIINIPPRSGKTELITKCFPVWALGNKPDTEIIATGYSTSLTQTFSGQARDYYKSNTFKRIFPRAPQLRKDIDTKEWWVNEAGGGYYATGSSGSITGRGANIFIIDDPIKPDEAENSDVKRIGVNNWYENTVRSRLNNMLTDAIIIVMQRTHENDLCGHIIEKITNGTEDQWDILSFPAIAEEDGLERKRGESVFEERLPLEALKRLRQADPIVFECQYQQNPTSVHTREFHPEYFKYIDQIPAGGRIFTAVDPAFTQKQSSDETAVVTAKFVQDRMYIIDITYGRFDPATMEDFIVQHIRRWRPEKVGVEAYQAQSMITFSLKNRLQKEGLYTTVEDIRQAGDKLSKLRRLVPLYRNGLIYHLKDLPQVAYLEQQLLKFPRGKHDDVIDAVQMLYDLYSLQPNTGAYVKPRIEYDRLGKPKILGGGVADMFADMGFK